MGCRNTELKHAGVLDKNRKVDNVQKHMSKNKVICLLQTLYHIEFRSDITASAILVLLAVVFCGMMFIPSSVEICQLVPKLVGGTNLETRFTSPLFFRGRKAAEESTPFLGGYREIFTRGQSNRSVNVISHLHTVSNLINKEVWPPRLSLCLYCQVLICEENCTAVISIE
jgi:hypothetical protein